MSTLSTSPDQTAIKPRATDSFCRGGRSAELLPRSAAAGLSKKWECLSKTTRRRQGNGHDDSGGRARGLRGKEIKIYSFLPQGCRRGARGARARHRLPRRALACASLAHPRRPLRDYTVSPSLPDRERSDSTRRPSGRCQDTHLAGVTFLHLTLSSSSRAARAHRISRPPALLPPGLPCPARGGAGVGWRHGTIMNPGALVLFSGPSHLLKR